MMQNKDYIEAYKSEDKIIADYYKLNVNGKQQDLTGIICPLAIDNRQLVSPIDDQSETPHCAGYSAATLVESIYWKKTGKLLQLDSHQVYALAKQLDGDVNIEGTYLEASLNAVLKLCKNESKFDFLDNAKVGVVYNDKISNVVQNVKRVVHQHDFIQAGFNTDEGWDYCNNSNYVLKSYGRSLGGHAVVICGWDQTGFYICNQWSTDWGAKGFAVMPYDVFNRQFMYGAYLYDYSI